MVEPLPVFPSSGCIPPACFYDRQGLATWLNQHPTYKQYFINYPNLFPYLYSQSTVQEWSSMANGPFSSMFMLFQNYDIQKVPLSPFVTTLSQYQSRRYQEQLLLFRQVYGYNSNAYVEARSTGGSPSYYPFSSSRELLEYRGSIGLVNKLYPFEAMANGTNENGQRLGWIVPFPL